MHRPSVPAALRRLSPAGVIWATRPRCAQGPGLPGGRLPRQPLNPGPASKSRSAGVGLCPKGACLMRRFVFLTVTALVVAGRAGSVSGSWPGRRLTARRHQDHLGYRLHRTRFRDRVPLRHGRKWDTWQPVRDRPLGHHRPQRRFERVGGQGRRRRHHQHVHHHRDIRQLLRRPVHRPGDLAGQCQQSFRNDDF